MKSLLKPLSDMLKKREISSVELTRKYLKEIESSDLNAYVHVCGQEALAAAERADELLSRGEGSPLTGIPFALKDNICTDGIQTTCCSRILSGFKPIYDATAYKKLKDLGAPLLGKTNMDEFAMGSTSETSFFGAPKNPLDKSRVTGGSSGGSAAAVCANLAPYALGTDTGGSIRQPASFCGVVGFKPTYGAVSRYGLIAYGSSLDQIGPITRSVSDAALVFDTIKGADSMDMTSCPMGGETYLNPEVKGLKIGVPQNFFDGLDGGVSSAVKAAIEKYVSYGAKIREISLPSLDKALPVYYILACAEASSNLGRYDGIRYGYRAENYSSLDDMVIKTRSEGFGKEVKKRIMLGTYVLSGGYIDAYYKKARILRGRITEEFDRAFEECDVIMTPSAPGTAFPVGFSEENKMATYLADICSVPVNIAGLPAISVPCGSSGGMPVGLQIMGARFDDQKVLSAAYFAEQTPLGDVPEYTGGVKL